MQRIRDLNFYQKGVLMVMLIMAAVFAVIYPRTVSRVGFRYQDAILVPAEENGNTVYSGKIQGRPAEFIVSDHEVTFRWGEKSYGQYTLTEDPAAVPAKEELAERMTGIEISHDDEILFRGGVLDVGDSYWLYSEDGTLDSLSISYVTSDGIERDEHGNVIDRMEPSASVIYDLLNEPRLTHKGEAFAWFGAAVICLFNAVSILFADELFRWNLRFQIRYAECAEPSDWEIAGRYIGWTVMTVMALVIFVMGLQ